MNTGPISDAHAAIVPLGFERFRALFAEHADAGRFPGRIARIDYGGAMVLTAEGSILAEPSATLQRSRDIADRPAVGDWVALARPEGHDVTLIEAILPRSSAFTRVDTGKETLAQVVAANVDTVFVVQALVPGLNPRRLERELALAWESGAAPVVILAKADLAADGEQTVRDAESVALGVPVHLVSSVTGDGVDMLHTYTDGGRTVALLGASGVGKSTLVNRIVGSELQLTGDVREGDSRGRHITTARELIPLPGGGVLLDTPGMRAVGLWEAEDGLAAVFPDIEQLANSCRFRDCRHESEPGCAVRAAVEAGSLAADRYESYLHLIRELEHLAAKQDARLQALRDAKWKTIHKELRHMPKKGR